VSTYYEKAEAENEAASVLGVSDVSNQINVVDITEPMTYDPYVDDEYLYEYTWYDYAPAGAIETDWDIRDEINDEMWWSPYVDSDEVTVSVEDGVATLTGTVDSWMEYDAARENAFEGGATGVVNRLTVE
jgi:osmotically-inducible protein OsmY